VASLGSLTSRNDTAVLGEGDLGHGRGPSGGVRTARDGSDRLCGKREAEYETESLGNVVTARNDIVVRRASKNEVAAASLMTSMEEKWKGGVSSAGGIIENGGKRIKRPDGVSDQFMKAVEETVRVVERYFTPSGGSNWPSVAEVVFECFTAADQVYGEERANKFAENHRWTEEKLLADLTAYQEAGFSISEMVKTRRLKNAKERMNVERVGRLRGDNPEIGKLLSLCEGMIVPLPPNFRPNSLCDQDTERLLCMQRAFFAWASREDGLIKARDPDTDPCVRVYDRALHPSYVRTHKAVDQMLNVLVNQEVCFVLPRSVVQEHSAVHYMVGKWTSKPGKDIGRNIGDMTYGTPPWLNGDFSKEASADFYGPIVHPTLKDLVLMLLDTFDKKKAEFPDLEWGDMTIWVMDIAAAYTHLDIPPEMSHLFAQEIMNGLIILHHCGVFGGSVTPAAFQPVTRCVLHEVRATTKGGAEMYVDDLAGVCMKKDVEEEMSKAEHVITDLLGPGSVQVEKNVTGQVVTIIGWTFNLTDQTVTVARKNLMKAIYCIFNVDLDGMTNLREIQRLASYLERYSVICRILRPFLSCLNRMMKEFYGLRRDFKFSEEAIMELRMWRGWLYLLSVDPGTYSRPFVTFRDREPSYVITTDGSLGQIGIIIYRMGGASEACVGCSAVSIAGFGFEDDSSYQNTCEYIGMVLGVLALIKLGIRGVDVVVRGDSTTALSWVQKEKVSGKAAMNAALVLVSLCIKFGIEVNYLEFLDGLANHKADRLSRLIEKKMSIERAMEINGHSGAEVIDLLGDQASATLVDMCNPGRGLDSEESFGVVWIAIRDAVLAL
jgi:hypothetical protein